MGLDVAAINAILSTRNGVWTLVVMAFVIAWRGWPHIPAIMGAWAARRKAIADERTADWTRIRDRLEAVEVRHEKCEHDLHAEREQRIGDISDLRDQLAGEKAERMRLERLLFAEGEIRQAKAQVQAEIRSSPESAPTAAKRFNGDKGGEGK